MTTTKMIRAATAALTLVGTSLLTSQAHAQTYTYRLLSTPLGAHGCIAERFMGQALNDKGEVAGLCSFWSGYAWGTGGSGLPVLESVYGTSKPYAWSATGAARALSLPSGVGVDMPNIDNAGKVRGSPYQKPGGVPDRSQLLVWNGTQRTQWAAPSPDWSVNWVSPDGQLLGLRPDGLGIFAGNTLSSTMPLPPVADASRSNVSWAVMNDAGQIAYYFDRLVPDEDSIGQLWTWRNGSWTQVLAPAFYPAYPQPRLQVNVAGTIMASNSGWSIYTSRDVTWRDGQLSALPLIDMPHRYTAMSPSSTADVVGWMQAVGSSSSPSRATLWRNGVAIDLNTRVKLPSGLVLTEALDINQRGQILVRTTSQLAVLTPK